MDYLAPLIIIIICFLGLGIGIILTGKPMKRCCSDQPKGCCNDEKCEDNTKKAES